VSRKHEPGTKPVKVLIVEDSRIQAEILKDLLVEQGYEPTLAENGRVALGLLGTVQPDAVISDVIMPEMDGYEFCRTLKNDARYRHIPVILLTMLTDIRDVIYAMESGADNFIVKPYKSEYILARLNEVIERAKPGTLAVSDEDPIAITIAGQDFTIGQGRRQVIDFLLSSYEAAVIQHKEVLSAQSRLAEANDEANLYLDIITHDINNVNMGALALTELLLQKIPEEEKTLGMRLIACINQSVEIIGNVSTIRRLHERREAIQPIELDAVIKNEIQHFSTTRIDYTGTHARILADTLMCQIFTNLIGNSVKFGGTNARIEIEVRDAGDLVEVIVADNGPGVADSLKPVIFDRFRKGKNARTGKGLGLFISRMLVEMYGGKIWASDRVSGHPKKGAAIHFTLPRAP
jgi:signal transduction histidine kinase